MIVVPGTTVAKARFRIQPERAPQLLPAGRLSSRGAAALRWGILCGTRRPVPRGTGGGPAPMVPGAVREGLLPFQVPRSTVPQVSHREPKQRAVSRCTHGPFLLVAGSSRMQSLRMKGPARTGSGNRKSPYAKFFSSFTAMDPILLNTT